jgi:integrase
VKFFVCWHGRNGVMRHPPEMAGPEIEAFLGCNRIISSVLTNFSAAGGLAQMNEITALLYGTGMRLMESMRLRINDVDFEAHLHYAIHSCSRDILLVYSPISILKTVPKLVDPRFSADFPALRESQTLQNGDFERFLRYLSGCSPIEYCGSSYVIHSVYFPVGSWRHLSEQLPAGGDGACL